MVYLRSSLTALATSVPLDDSAVLTSFSSLTFDGRVHVPFYRQVYLVAVCGPADAAGGGGRPVWEF